MAASIAVCPVGHHTAYQPIVHSQLAMSPSTFYHRVNARLRCTATEFDRRESKQPPASITSSPLFRRVPIDCDLRALCHFGWALSSSRSLCSFYHGVLRTARRCGKNQPFTSPPSPPQGLMQRVVSMSPKQLGADSIAALASTRRPLQVSLLARTATAQCQSLVVVKKPPPRRSPNYRFHSIEARNRYDAFNPEAISGIRSTPDAEAFFFRWNVSLIGTETNRGCTGNRRARLRIAPAADLRRQTCLGVNQLRKGCSVQLSLSIQVC